MTAQPLPRHPRVNGHELPPPVESGLPVPLGVIPLEELERQHILSALRHASGNRTRAAGLLGGSIRILRNKLQEYRAAGLVIAGDDPPDD